MAITPEGKVKKAITKKLKEMNCWYYMPVSAGYGAPTIDYICSLCGKSFCIEAKAPGEKPTTRQTITMVAMGKQGVPSVVIDSGGADKMKYLEAWILMVCTSGRTRVEGNTQSEGNVWGTDSERE